MFNTCFRAKTPVFRTLKEFEHNNVQQLNFNCFYLSTAHGRSNRRFKHIFFQNFVSNAIVINTYITETLMMVKTIIN